MSAGLRNLEALLTLRDRFSREHGVTLVEMMVVVVILGILATVSTLIITTIFNANIQGTEKLNQQSTMQLTNSFFNKQVTLTAQGNVGGVSSGGTKINSTSLAGDQFTMVADKYCYRMIYFPVAGSVVAVSQAVDQNTGKCQTGSSGITPSAGPTDSASAIAADPVLSKFDLTTGELRDPAQPLGNGRAWFTLADNVSEMPTGNPAFSFQNGGSTTMNVDSAASSSSSNGFYSDPTRLKQISAVEVNLDVAGFAKDATIKIGTQELKNTFYVGAGDDGGSLASSDSGADRLAARAVTDSPLPSVTLATNALTENGVGALPSIDGVALQPGDRVLVKDQVDASQDGLYEVTRTGSDTIPGLPAKSGKAADYGPSMYLANMGTSLADASSGGHSGSWGAVTTGGGPMPACPTGTTSFSESSVTGVAGNGGWGGQLTTWGGQQYPTYTNDSPVAKMAVHAGLLTAGQTATIRVCQLPGLTAYTGSTKNGVTTASYGSWGGSIVLLKAPTSTTTYPAGSTATGFESWESSPHNAVSLNGTTYIQTSFNNPWGGGTDPNAGNATILTGFNRTSATGTQSLFSTDGTTGGVYALDAAVTASGDVYLDTMRSATAPTERITWSVSLGGGNLNSWTGKWVGAAFAFSSNGSQVTLYLKDLSAPGNPWVSQGTKPATYGSILACPRSASIPCSSWPGNLVIGARATGTTVDQKFVGSLSQFAVYPKTIDLSDVNIFSNGTPATPDTPGTSFQLTRVPEMDESTDLVPGELVTVAEGTANGDSIWQLTSDAPLTINSSNLKFARKDGLTKEQAKGLVPTGTTIAYTGTSAPNGYLMANGQAVSRTTYSALFQVICPGGNSCPYGNGDGSTTFNLPNLTNGRAPVGAGAGVGSLGSAGGAQTHTLTQAELPAASVYTGVNVWSNVNVNVSVYNSLPLYDGSGGWGHTNGGDEGWWSWQNTPVCGALPGICNGAGWTFNGVQDANLGLTAWAQGWSNGSGSGSGAGSGGGWSNPLGNGQSFSTMSPYQVVNYIIKY